MNIKFIAIPAIALAAGISLAACGSAKAAPAVTHTVTAPAAAPKPTTPAPTTPAPTTAAPAPVVVVPAPAKTMYVQAPAPPQPDQHAQTACGSGIYVGPSTSCSFAADVVQAYRAGGYWYQPGTSYFTADGQSMTSASVGNPVIVTSGSGNLIYFNY